MIHALSCGTFPLYFETPCFLSHKNALTLRKRREFSPEFLRRFHRQRACQKERVVAQDGLLVDCPKLRQFEYGYADRVDGDAQFKLVDRFIDIRASLRERLHQHQRNQVSEVAALRSVLPMAIIVCVGEGDHDISHFPSVHTLREGSAYSILNRPVEVQRQSAAGTFIRYPAAHRPWLNLQANGCHKWVIRRSHDFYSLSCPSGLFDTDDAGLREVNIQVIVFLEHALDHLFLYLPEYAEIDGLMNIILQHRDQGIFLCQFHKHLIELMILFAARGFNTRL